MCGIIGQISKDRVIDKSNFISMRDTMSHRGPDGEGAVFLNDNRVALGHRRLSIIDLSDASSQPLCNETEDIWITFNGEIYNYKKIRAELIQKGHIFKSAGDTEVLVHGYEEWGIKGLLSRLKGMFAFGIWDEKRQKLFLARDRFGIKPLVFSKQGSTFTFASELKAISRDSDFKKTINREAIADYFIYSYVPYPNTIWKDAYKLPPATFLEFDYNNFDYTEHEYWSLKPGYQKMGDQDALEKTHELLQTAVHEHLASDVPVGLFLSGGYDSGTLLMHLHDMGEQVSCYTLAFPDSDKNEVFEASLLAKTFDSAHKTEVISEYTDTLKILEEMYAYYDEPFAASSMVNVYQLSKLAARDTKVVLSGEGADELFGGYRWHRKIENYYQNIGLKQYVKGWLNGDFTEKSRYLSLYNRSMTGVMSEVRLNSFLSDDLTRLVQNRGLKHFGQFYLANQNPVKLCQYLDSLTFIPNHCLFRADISSMAHSLEIRLPFLDHELFEFVFGLHPDVYMKPGVKKYLLEERLKGRVPNEIIKMPKRGFSFQNLDHIFDRRFKMRMQNGCLVNEGILNKNISFDTLSADVKLHLFNLELWFSRYV